MEKDVFTIDNLYGSAYNNAIENVAVILGKDKREWRAIQDVAFRLGVKFDVNGNIVRK